MDELTTPNIDALIANGSVSLSAINTSVNGESGTNWSSLFTGVTPARYGITGNGDGNHNIDDDFTNSNTSGPSDPGRVPTLWGYLKDFDSNLQTGLFPKWGGIRVGNNDIHEFSSSVLDTHIASGQIINSSDIPGNPFDDPNNPNDGGDQAIADSVSSLLTGTGPFAGSGLDPDVVMLHFGEVDTHTTIKSGGQFTQSIISRVTAVDGYIGEVMAALNSRPNIANEEWLVVLTADHGATDTGAHGGTNTLQRTIPFIVSGDLITNGADIDSGGVPRIWDVTPTVLQWMGINTLAYGFDGEAVLPGINLPLGVADLDQNGSLNSTDWDLFRTQQGANMAGLTTVQSLSLGDLDHDLDNDIDDFIIFEAEYNTENGTGALAALVAVPEPSALLLFVFGLAVLRCKRLCR